MDIVYNLRNRRLRRRFSRPSGVGGVDFVNQVIPSFLSIAIKCKKVCPDGQTDKRTDKQMDRHCVWVHIWVSELLYFSMDFTIRYYIGLPMAQGFSKKLNEPIQSRNKKVMGSKVWVSGRTNRQTDRQTEGHRLSGILI